MAAIRTFGSLSKVARNPRLERLSASAARVVPATISLVIGRVVCGENCSGKLGMASDLGPKRGAWTFESINPPLSPASGVAWTRRVPVGGSVTQPWSRSSRNRHPWVIPHDPACLGLLPSSVRGHASIGVLRDYSPKYLEEEFSEVRIQHPA